MVYALSDMALCVGFTVGPIAGPLLQEAFGGGNVWVNIILLEQLIMFFCSGSFSMPLHGILGCQTAVHSFICCLIFICTVFYCLLTTLHHIGTNGFQVAALTMGLICACILPFPYIVLHDHHGVHSNKAQQSSDSGHKIEILSEVQHHGTVNALHGQSSNAISVPLRKQQANGNVVISATNSSSLDSHASV